MKQTLKSQWLNPADCCFSFVGDRCRSSRSLVWLPSGRWPQGSRPCSSSSCPGITHTSRRLWEGRSSPLTWLAMLKSFRLEGILAPRPLAGTRHGVCPLPCRGVGVLGSVEEHMATGVLATLLSYFISLKLTVHISESNSGAGPQTPVTVSSVGSCSSSRTMALHEWNVFGTC